MTFLETKNTFLADFTENLLEAQQIVYLQSFYFSRYVSIMSHK